MPAENVPAVQIALGLLSESEVPEKVEEAAVEGALASLAEGVDAPRPQVMPGPRRGPELVAAAPSRGGDAVIEQLLTELELEPHDRAAIRALMAAGLDAAAIRELAAALLGAVPESPGLALSVFRAFADRLGYGTVPGIRPRLSPPAVRLLGEVAGQTAWELQRVLPAPAAAELAAATAWPLSDLTAEQIVSTPVAMVEMLTTSREAGPARVTALALAAPEWFAAHMSREEQLHDRALAGEIVESLLGKLPAHERGYAEGAAIAAAERFGPDAARALLAAYVQVVGEAAGLLLATAIAEMNERDDARQESQLQFLAQLVLELDEQLDRATCALGPGAPTGGPLSARAHLASHAAEQLVAAGSTQAFLLVLRLLQRNTRLTPRQRIQRLAELPRSLSASADPEALERWVMATPRRRSA